MTEVAPSVGEFFRYHGKTGSPLQLTLACYDQVLHDDECDEEDGSGTNHETDDETDGRDGNGEGDSNGSDDRDEDEMDRGDGDAEGYVNESDDGDDDGSNEESGGGGDVESLEYRITDFTVRRKPC